MRRHLPAFGRDPDVGHPSTGRHVIDAALPSGNTAAELRSAALWMLGAIVSFSAMAVAGRSVSIELDTFELMFYRSVIGLGIVLSISRLAATHRQIRATRLGLHAVRNVFHFGGQNLWFYAISVIPLAQVFALEFTAPIWIALAAPLILGERLTRRRVAAALIGFLGVLLVARPGVAAITAGQVAAAAAAIGFAGSAIFTKRLTRTETITSILFWLTLMQAVMGAVCAGLDGEIALPSAGLWPGLALIGAAGLAAHLCLTTALSLAPATLVMPMDFMRLPVIAVVGMALYAEPLDPFVFAGGALIIGANYVNLRTSRSASVAGK